MSAVDHKGDCASGGKDENMEAIENRESQTDDHHLKKISEIGSGDSKKSEKEGNLMSIELEEEEVVKITEINPLELNTVKSSITSFTDDNLATILSMTTPSTSKVIEKSIVLDTNDIDTKSHSDTTPIIEISKSDESLIGKMLQNQSNDEKDQVTASKDNKTEATDKHNDSFDIELKWDDDESEHELSEEALKLLDQELGIDDIISTNEIESKTLQNTNTAINNSKSDVDDVNAIDKNDQLEAKTDVKDNEKTSNEEISSQSNTIEENAIKSQDSELNKDCIHLDVDEPTAVTSNPSGEKNISTEKMDVDIIDNLNIDKTNEGRKEIADTDIEMHDSTNTGITDEVKNENYKLTSLIVEEVNIDSNKDTESIILIEKTNEDDRSETSDNIKNDKVEMPCIGHNTITVESIEVIETDDDNKQETTVIKKETADDDLKNEELINTNDDLSEQKTMDNNTGTPKQGQALGMKTNLGLNKPDIMLEIPTQELIDIDEFDESFDVKKEADALENVTANEVEIKDQVDTATKITSDDKPELTVTDIVKEKEDSKALNDKEDLNIKTADTTEKSADTNVKSADININSIDTNVNPNEKPLLGDAKPSTSKSVIDVVDIPISDTKSVDNNVKSANTDLTANEQASNSKIEDSMVEEPEVTESLLAESSRTVDDDDDHDEDDSDDFDQDDESSNHMTAEHSEESNPPPSESDLVKEEECEKEIALPGDSMVETEAQCDDNDEPGLDIVDDIDCEETVLAEGGVDTMNDDSLDIKLPLQKYEMSEQESQQKDKEVASEKEKESMLRNLLSKEGKDPPIGKKSPSKRRLIQLNDSTAKILSFVDLEESSDEDTKGTNKVKNEPKKENEDSSIDITKDEASTEENSVLKSKAAFKMTKLNTGEVSIKTGVSTKPPLIIPEITNTNQVVNKQKNTLTEEVFTLDSDSEEEKEPPPKEEEEQAPNIEAQTKFNTKCINPMCTTSFSEQHYVADANAVRYYGPTKKRAVCGPCLKEVQKRNQSLIDGIKNLTPLLELNMDKPTNQLVEISDSESEDESEILKECKEIIGGSEANMLSEKLVDLINEAWQKFNMDDRLKASEDFINKELQKLEDEGTEVNKLLNECQKETDKIRTDLYNTFYKPSTQLPAIAMYDTPVRNYTCLERDAPMPKILPARQSKSDEPPAKKVNRGANEASATDKKEEAKSDKQDDDRDVSVVLLSAEAAPAWLPPAGELARPALEPGLPVHAMRNAFGSWLRARIQDVLPKTPQQQYTNCRVKFEHNMKNQCKVLPARCLAYQEPCNVRMTIGTRVLALFRDVRRKESFYSGVVAEIPNPVNSYRYLVFFDDGYAQYVKHQDTRLVCESKSSVWEEVHPFIRDFVREYLLKYPERPMVRMRTGEQLNTEWNGKWWRSKVLQVDASLALVHFIDDDRTEWIYRGSTRLAPLYLELQAAERHRTRLPRSKGQFSRTNMPYVEYMRSEEQPKTQQQEEILRRQRAVAKKSTTQAQAAPPDDKSESAYSRVVHYTPKNAVKPHKMVPHTCGPHCKRNDVLSLKDLKTYNPLTKPLLSGWERILVRYKGIRAIMYRAPCGRRLRHMIELHRYLQLTDSELPVDLFDFSTNTQCLAEYVIHNNIVMKKDLSHGKENVPIPCVNHLDDSLPEFCSYNTERTPTSGVPLNLDPEFLCGCDCEDDCEDKSKCACWQMTLEGARTIGLDDDVGYLYRRLPEPLPSGIYECNSRCKCKSTCLNRVAQHPLQLKLQVFKTNKRGWGIRALNDVPKGAFLCVYAGNLLTDATANLDGLNEGDEYLAELDYIEVVEQMKEGFEEDIPEADKKLDKKESKVKSASENEEETESEEEQNDSDKMDDDFQPGHIGMGLIDFDKRLRKRNKKKQEDNNKEKEKEGEGEKTDNCITISDDEEVREPSRFTAQAGMGDKEFVSKYRSVRTLFGEDEACYIMDAKVQGNIGRYLNHSCQPNVFVQNVFVDTHDPRFPWVAFFALTYIKAGTELTWNYNYDIGSVPGKVLYCFCGADNCRGRLL